MQSDQLALVMVAGIWAALNTLVSAYKVVNDKRDVIVTGIYEGEQLTLEHRRLMLVNDWIPLKFGVAIASLIFAFALFAIPYLASNPNEWLIALSYFAAFGPFVSFIAFSILGWRDYRFIKRCLNETHEAAKRAA
jgi:nitrate/nitrite transporter NarK